MAEAFVKTLKRDYVRVSPIPNAAAALALIVLAYSPAPGMAFEQKTMLLHQPVHALGIDRGRTIGSPLALEERGDPPVAVKPAPAQAGVGRWSTKRRISPASST